MRIECNDGLVTVGLEGRLDSSNAPDIEQTIQEGIKDCAFSTMIIDAQKLTYISSAGLRVILKLLKGTQHLRIVGVSPEVYEVFEMTGFTEMMDIEKAYRVFDVSDCELIGEGANGKIYRIDNELIIKVYKDAVSPEIVKREHELSRTALILGIPTAIPFDVVRVGDTYGSVFELLNAKSFAELLRDDPSALEDIAKATVFLAKTLHSTTAPDNLPRQSDISLEWLNEAQACFDEQHFQKLSALIGSIPETGTMLHGDLHIKNIMQMDSEALLIDMDTLCTGHPIYELAFIYNAYEGFGICDKGEIKRFLSVDEATAARLLDRILALYLDTDDAQRISEVKEKAAVIGLLRVLRRVIRIKEQDTPEGSQLISACKNRIINAIGHLDTLTF